MTHPSRAFSILSLMLALAPLAGCASAIVPNQPGDLSQGTSVSLEKWGRLKDDLFVGVSISGGGMRSANFSAAVLLELEKHGLLENLSALSAVSGGSLTAAYYALHRSQKNTWNEQSVRDRLLVDLEARLYRKLLNPAAILRLLIGSTSRSTLLWEILDDTLYGGQTFAALPGEGPQLFINATSHTRGGEPVVFTEEYFAGIGSRLDTFPIAAAVTASSAYPGFLSEVVLRNYAASEARGGPSRYERLYDGGVHDNLGLVTLLLAAQRAREAYSARGQAIKGCFLFVINAEQRVIRRDVSPSHPWSGSRNPQGPASREGTWTVRSAYRSLGPACG